MFRKLVSNVSFSPALVGQLGFYARRLKKEEATRRIGLIFTALALVVQSFAVFSAPEPANAASSNDMVRGGVSSLSEYMRHYDANTNGVKDLYQELGITRSEVANAKAGTINSKAGYLSWGMKPQFSAAKGEKKYTVKNSRGGSTTFYSRPLRLWDSNNYTKQNGSTYQVYIGHSAKFGWFAIMKNCGNLATKKHPTPPKPQPKPAASCTRLDVIKVNDSQRRMTATSKVINGAKVSGYTFEAKDASGKVVHSVAVPSSSTTASTQPLQFSPGSYTATVTVNTTVGDKTAPACAAKFTVAKPGVSIEKTVNGEKHAEVKVDEEFEYKVTVTNTGATTLRSLKVTDPAPKNVTFISSSAGKTTPTSWEHTIESLAAGKSESFTIKAKATAAAAQDASSNKNTACVDTPDIPGSPDDCDDATIEVPEQPIQVCELESGTIITIKKDEFDESLHSTQLEDCASTVTSAKSAVNNTQGGVDATTVAAKANDRITYTLTLKNTGQQPAKSVITEKLADVLEYAAVIDAGGADYNQTEQTLTWPEVELAANQEVTRMFTVQLASTIPAAARGTSDKTSYDCIILNTFGNSVQIPVECPGPKQVEQVVTELPHTGPTENIVFGGILFAIVTYFYARSRQLKTEVRLIRRSVNAGTV